MKVIAYFFLATLAFSNTAFANSNTEIRIENIADMENEFTTQYSEIIESGIIQAFAINGHLVFPKESFNLLEINDINYIEELEYQGFFFTMIEKNGEIAFLADDDLVAMLDESIEAVKDPKQCALGIAGGAVLGALAGKGSPAGMIVGAAAGAASGAAATDGCKQKTTSSSNNGNNRGSGSGASSNTSCERRDPVRDAQLNRR